MRVLLLAICLCQVLCLSSERAVAWEGGMGPYCQREEALKKRLAAMSSEQRSMYDEEQRELAAALAIQTAEQRKRAEEAHVLQYLGNAFSDPAPGSGGNRLRTLVLGLLNLPTRVDSATSPLRKPPVAFVGEPEGFHIVCACTANVQVYSPRSQQEGSSGSDNDQYSPETASEQPSPGMVAMTGGDLPPVILPPSDYAGERYAAPAANESDDDEFTRRRGLATPPHSLPSKIIVGGSRRQTT